MLDGETNDKDRYPTHLTLHALKKDSAQSDRRIEGDAIFSRHLHIIRQGASISKNQAK
jgi:hypothetical protein